MRRAPTTRPLGGEHGRGVDGPAAIVAVLGSFAGCVRGGRLRRAAGSSEPFPARAPVGVRAEVVGGLGAIRPRRARAYRGRAAREPPRGPGRAEMRGRSM